MVFNATFNNISVMLWRSILLMEKTGAPGQNNPPIASHCKLRKLTLLTSQSYIILVLTIRSFSTLFNFNLEVHVRFFRSAVKDHWLNYLYVNNRHQWKFTRKENTPILLSYSMFINLISWRMQIWYILP
jgi:hypothetical protein